MQDYRQGNTITETDMVVSIRYLHREDGSERGIQDSLYPLDEPVILKDLLAYTHISAVMSTVTFAPPSVSTSSAILLSPFSNAGVFGSICGLFEDKDMVGLNPVLRDCMLYR